MNFAPFYVEHTNTIIVTNDDGKLQPAKLKEDLNEKLGTGLVVGTVMTGEGLKSLVIWEGQRYPSPSMHNPIELAWLGMYEDGDGFGEDDGDDDDGDEDDTTINVADTDNEDGGDFDTEENPVAVQTGTVGDDGDFDNDNTVVDTEVVNSEVETESQRL